MYYSICLYIYFSWEWAPGNWPMQAQGHMKVGLITMWMYKGNTHIYLCLISLGKATYFMVMFL